MSNRGIKSKVIKKSLANKDILDMFQGILGNSSESSSLMLTHPKYQQIKTNVLRGAKVLKIMQGSRLMSRYPILTEELIAYTDNLNNQIADSFNAPSFTEWIPSVNATKEHYNRIPAEVKLTFTEKYNAVKKCNAVNVFIVACKNLILYRKSIEDQKNLKDRFLLKGAEMTISPLPGLSMNFKKMYIDDRLSKEDRDFILVVLHKIYTVGNDLYKVISSPDVDVTEFIEVIMTSIGEVKKHIPRCNEAFQKIIDSVDLLKGNFGEYYKDYASSGNPAIIMENFVLDVSKNTTTSPLITSQFRRIISHYRKLASSQAANPKMQSLFDQVDANFTELENMSKQVESSESSSDEDIKEKKKLSPAQKARKRRNRIKSRLRAKLDKVLSDEPVVDEPVVDEPVVDEPVVDESVVDESVVDESVVDEPVVDEPVIDESVVYESVVDESVVDESVVDESVVYE